MGLKGRTAIVTGGNRGIGKAITLTLARSGVRVMISGRDREALGYLKSLALEESSVMSKSRPYAPPL